MLLLILVSCGEQVGDPGIEVHVDTPECKYILVGTIDQIPTVTTKKGVVIEDVPGLYFYHSEKKDTMFLMAYPVEGTNLVYPDPAVLAWEQTRFLSKRSKKIAAPDTVYERLGKYYSKE